MVGTLLGGAAVRYKFTDECKAVEGHHAGFLSTGAYRHNKISAKIMSCYFQTMSG